MEVKAVGKYVKVQPRKVRIVADKVRGALAARSAVILGFHPSKAAQMLRKVIISAIANAENNHGLSPENLRIAQVMVDEGPRQKRIQPRAMGRAFRILKKTSHITVVVEEIEGETPKKTKTTKAKSRPSFGEPKRGKAKAKAKAAEIKEVAAETQVEETKTAGETEATPEPEAIEPAVPEVQPTAEEESPAGSESESATESPEASETSDSSDASEQSLSEEITDSKEAEEKKGAE